MIKKLTAAIFALIIGAFIVITVNSAPVKIIHPDSLRFMAIFQQQYDTVESVSDVPRAIFQGIKNSNEYDFYRGRITNYVAFGLEALTRSYLPLPFISWLTMAIVILNGILLARLVTKEMQVTVASSLLFILSVLALLINPIVMASYEMQFIFSKYLCITFIFLFLHSDKPQFKVASLIGAMFSDEIGIAFAMLAMFLMVFNVKVKAFEANHLDLKSVIKSIGSSVMAALAVLLLYFAILKALFGHISRLILNGGFTPNDASVLSTLDASIISLLNVMDIAVGKTGIAIFVLVICFAIYKKIKESRHSELFIQTQPLPWKLYLANKRVQEISVAIFMVMFITYKMYRGKVDVVYYSYPVYMLIMFVMLSLLMKTLPQKFAVSAMSIIVLALILHAPAGNAIIKKEASSVWIVDNTVSLESFRAVEHTINELNQNNCISEFDVINNAQDNNFYGNVYNYGEKYFPALGIVKVLAWPHKIQRCALSHPL